MPFDIASISNADYIDEMYQKYKEDPSSIDGQWQAFFAGFDLGTRGEAPANSGHDTFEYGQLGFYGTQNSQIAQKREAGKLYWSAGYGSYCYGDSVDSFGPTEGNCGHCFGFCIDRRVHAC